MVSTIITDGLGTVVRELFARKVEKKVPLNVGLVDFRRTFDCLELYHDAKEKYGVAFLVEYTFLSQPFSIAADDPSAEEIGQKLSVVKNSRFEGELILAWDRLSSLLGEDTRAGLQGKLMIGNDQYDARFNVESWPSIPPIYLIHSVQISKKS